MKYDTNRLIPENHSDVKDGNNILKPLKTSDSNPIKQFKSNYIIIFQPCKITVGIMTKYFQYVNKISLNNGIKTTIGILKEVYRLTSRSIMSQDDKSQIGPCWIAVNKHGFPKFLGLKSRDIHLLKKDAKFQREVLSLLNYYRSLSTEVTYDINTVTEPLKVPSDVTNLQIEELSDSFQRTINDFKIESFEVKDEKPSHVTTKSGGCGPKSMGLTSILDLGVSIRDGYIDEILKIIPLVYTKKGNLKFQEIYSKSIELLEIVESKTNKSNDTTRRLHFISEGGGKTRVICIGDIWSQIALKPIHKYLMNQLKRFPNDGTSSHNRISIKVKEMTKDTDLFCYDLKAATDRLPLDLQLKVISHLFEEASPEISSLWKTIISRKVKFRDKFISYSVGQPMGLLSSWAVMALTHHFIVNYCFSKHKISKFMRNYAIIGDDIVIGHKNVAEEYLKVMKNLGMEINFSKTIIPSETCKGKGEIAKRLFSLGREISPITPKTIQQGGYKLSSLLELVKLLRDRDYLDLKKADDTVHLTKMVIHMVSSMKYKSQLKACFFLTSPLCSFLNKELLCDSASFSRVTKSIWEGKLEVNFNNKFQQFLLERLSKRIIDFEQLNSKPINPVSGSKLFTTPIVDDYFKTSIEEMKAIINIYNTSYIDEEGDSDEILDATDPKYVLCEILSRPNPNDKAIYLTNAERTIGEMSSELERFIKSNIPKEYEMVCKRQIRLDTH